MRRAERNLLLSTMVVVLLSGVAFAVPFWKKAPARTQSSDDREFVAGCALIGKGMTSAMVSAKLGKADEVRPDEETRGPSASIWVYRQSRCAVHLFDDKVELIE
jgi:hypothetical protein